MKKINLIILILVGLFAIISCEKDETKVVIGVYNPPAITAPTGGTSYVLTEETETDTMTTFTWSAADFGFQSSVLYSVQFDFVGNDFASPGDMGSTNDLELAVTVGNVNQKIILAGGYTGVVNSLETRIMAVIQAIDKTNIDTLFSSSITMDVTPFEKIIIYPSVYVAGNYQAASGYTSDWSPDLGPQLYSLKDNEKYEGYVYMANGSNEFKFTDGPNWDLNWGDDGADGTLDENGANILEANAGYYKMNVDLNTFTYTYMGTDWGLIGDATPGGWDSDTNMTFDDVNHVWTITVDLVVGTIKFRANDDWALNYGDDGGDLKLDKDGADIAVAEAGNYTITMDLEQPMYRYTIVKN